MNLKIEELNNVTEETIKSSTSQIVVKDYDDVLKCVGCIIEIAQEWEQSYKEACELYDVDVKNLESATMNLCNKKLKNNGVINEDMAKKLFNAIQIRNDINHDFFLEIKKHPTFKLEQVEKYLKGAYFIICEGCDVINNLIDDKRNAGFGKRPNIFDGNFK